MKRILTVASLFLLCAGFSLTVNAATCNHSYNDDNSYYAPDGSVTCLEKIEGDEEYHLHHKKCSRCGDKQAVKEEHTYVNYNLPAEYIDNDSHLQGWECRCGQTKQTVEQHRGTTLKYTYVDETCHMRSFLCNKCSKYIESGTEEHTNVALYQPSEYLDNDHHLKSYKCEVCKGITKIQKPHTPVAMSFEKYDKTYHKVGYYCSSTDGDACNHDLDDVLEKHVYDDTCGYQRVDDNYHAYILKCSICSETTTGAKSAHNWSFYRAVQEATPTTPGIGEFKCYTCGATTNKQILYGSGFGDADYDVYISSVFSNSKSITVRISHPLKGGTLQVKIGKKTYKKKIKNNSTKIKIKLKKKPKWGQKITAKFSYNGKVVGSETDYVYFSKKIRKGMTQKQVAYTVGWGDNDCTVSSSSGGWKFWHYEDGSMVAFKGGKVKYWYNANG